MVKFSRWKEILNTNVLFQTNGGYSYFVDFLSKVWSVFTGGNVDVILSEDGFIQSMKSQIGDPAFNKTISEPLKIVFNAVDADGDGYIDWGELTQFFESLGMDRNFATVAFNAIDVDGDGLISLDEFIENGLDFFTSQDEGRGQFFLGPLIPLDDDIYYYE